MDKYLCSGMISLFLNILTALTFAWQVSFQLRLTHFYKRERSREKEMVVNGVNPSKFPSVLTLFVYCLWYFWFSGSFSFLCLHLIKKKYFPHNFRRRPPITNLRGTLLPHISRPSIPLPLATYLYTPWGLLCVF